MATQHYQHYQTCGLPSFGGGLLTATMRDPQSSEGVQIKTAGPGYIGARDLRVGPKDWSPHGLVPKDWQLLFKLDGSWVDILIIYMNIEGHEVMTRMNLSSIKNTSLYFVPM